MRSAAKKQLKRFLRVRQRFTSSHYIGNAANFQRQDYYSAGILLSGKRPWLHIAVIKT